MAREKVEKVYDEGVHDYRRIKISSKKLLDLLGDGFVVEYLSPSRNKTNLYPRITIISNDIFVYMMREK